MSDPEITITDPVFLNCAFFEVTDREEISISSWIRKAIERYLEYENNSGKE